MLRFTPQSRTTTCRRGFERGLPGQAFRPLVGGAAGDFLHQVDSDDPRRRGELFSSESRSRSTLEMTPCLAPSIRRCRVSARVSMPWIPTTPCCRKPGVQVLGGTPVGPRRALASRTTNPESQVPLDSLSSGHDAVVPDQGIGHCDDLSAIGGIGENFLIAGDRRVENDFAERLAPGAERFPFKNRFHLQEAVLLFPRLSVFPCILMHSRCPEIGCPTVTGAVPRSVKRPSSSGCTVDNVWYKVRGGRHEHPHFR